MGLMADLTGTSKSIFQVEKLGVKLENSSGNLVVKDNAGDESDVTVKKLFVQGEEIELNSDAAGSGADWKYNIARPASGQAHALTLVLPPTHGAANQILQTSGDDNYTTTWVNPPATTPLLTVDTTTLNWNSAAEVAMFTLPIGAVVDRVKVVIDTSFDGTTAATMSVGTSGAGAAKYMAATQVNLKGTAKDVYESNPGELAVSGTDETLVITFAAASGGVPSAGVARVMVFYVQPA